MKTRNKLMAAVVMLVVSALMLTTASFAWFTISTAPEVKGIDTKVVTNENLEIALAATGTSLPALPENGFSGNNYTWGNLLDLDAATKLDGATGTNEYNTFMADIALRPATLLTGGFFAPKYGTDGRVSTAVDGTDDITVSAETNKYGFGKLIGSDNLVYGYYVDIWMRSNVDGQVTLSAADNRAETETAMLGAGSIVSSENETFEKGMNVAFQVLAEAGPTATAATAVTKNVVKATNTDVAGSGYGEGNIEKANTLSITASDDFKLAANTATLVRVYVYLEGENITNADASIDGEGNSVIGTLNLQFAIDGVTNNMPVSAPTT